MNQHPSLPPPLPPPPLLSFFLLTKKKRKKQRIPKQKLSRGCHQDQNVTVLAILEHLQFKVFLVGQPW